MKRENGNDKKMIKKMKRENGNDKKMIKKWKGKMEMIKKW